MPERTSRRDLLGTRLPRERNAGASGVYRGTTHAWADLAIGHSG